MVECGGLENRCGLTLTGGSNPSPSANIIVKELLPVLIWTAVFGGLFVFAWKQGYVAKLSTYVGETQQELKKCNWPSREELIQSTLIIFAVIALLGIFTVCVDQLMIGFVKVLLKAS